MEKCDIPYLEHENQTYNQIRALQGYHIPVCLGAIDLDKPYYYNCGVYVRFLFLSWAGQPLFRCIRHDNKEHLYGKVETVLKALHKFKVLHRDAEPRNLLYDVENDQVMIIDLERAEYLGRQPLRPIQANRKKKRTGDKHQGNEDVFDRERRFALGCILNIRIR
jgi:hypothetical protein